MNFVGKGCFKVLIDEWNRLFRAIINCVVIQPRTISGFASMRIRNGKWTLDLGQ